MTYNPEQTRKRNAAMIERQRAELARLEIIEADTLHRANQAANHILQAAIRHADQITANARILAEHEANIIRERAYMEGRALADRERVTFDELARARELKRLADQERKTAC